MGEAERRDRFASVVLKLPIDKEFQYSIPPRLSGKIAPGKRVRVPFRNRVTSGFCVGLSSTLQTRQVKPILDIVDPEPMVGEKMLNLTRWLSRYYCCSWGEALEAAVPAPVRKGIKGRGVLYAVLAQPPDEIRKAAEALESQWPKRARILRLLMEEGAPLGFHEILRIVHSSSSPLRSLKKANLIRFFKRESPGDSFAFIPKISHPPPPPTPHQERALQEIKKAIDGGIFSVFLLYGITGSGKTEVYLRAIQKVLETGRQAIILVPEISLTPQTVSRFWSRFPSIALLHSSLSPGERYSQWRSIREGRANIVIGPRSAVFAPVKNLGLLIIDEEHETSFKQESVPRYHARDVGIMRAKEENAAVILGSATPSLESYFNALQGKYRLLCLPYRVAGRTLPRVEFIDLSELSWKEKEGGFLTRRLKFEIEAALKRKEQVLLFLNRRGYSTVAICRSCGFVLKCPRCEVAMTLHKRIGKVLCHYCNHESPPPSSCSQCGFPTVRFLGTGTEKIEDELARIFPNAAITRMDSDTTRTKHSHARILEGFQKKKIEILVGTQMIAKGLDFPNVTLVGVVSSDTALHLPDFRAAERTFQLVTQVAGRTGRGDVEGLVLVQSYHPGHFCLKTAAAQDFEGFARQELHFRKQLSYPPFGRLMLILVQGIKEGDVKEKAQELKTLLDPVVKLEGLELLGPAPAPISRMKNRFRWQLLVKAKRAGLLRKAYDTIRQASSSTRRLSVSVDVDPQTIL